jgi:hypothetical protein
MKNNILSKQFIFFLVSLFFTTVLNATHSPDSIDYSSMPMTVIEGTASEALSDIYIRAMLGPHKTKAMRMGAFYTLEQQTAFFGSNWLSVYDYNDSSEPVGYKYNGYLVSMHPENGFASFFVTTLKYAVLIRREDTLFLQVGMPYEDVEWPQDMHVNQPLYDTRHPDYYKIIAGGFGNDESSCMFELHINNSGIIIEIRVLVWP